MFCPFYVCAFVHLQVQLVSPSLTMYFFFSFLVFFIKMMKLLVQGCEEINLYNLFGMA